MPEGTIKKLVPEKGFGFIATDKGDLFFHASTLSEGVQYDSLKEGQAVTFTEGQGPKGARAENVSLAA